MRNCLAWYEAIFLRVRQNITRYFGSSLMGPVTTPPEFPFHKMRKVELSFCHFILHSPQNPRKVVNHDLCADGIWWNRFSYFIYAKYFKTIFYSIKMKKIGLQSHILGEMRTYLKSHQVLRERRMHFHIFAMKSKNWFYFTQLQISFSQHHHPTVLIIFIASQSRERLKLLTAFGAQVLVLEAFQIETF